MSMLARFSSTGSEPPVYVDDVFATYLYTGNGSTQTITNEIDLSTKGGLVWVAARSSAFGHYLYDTARGLPNRLSTHNTNAQASTTPAFISSFNTNGFSTQNDTASTALQTNGLLGATWTFRKQQKFFDVVTWSGDGTNNRKISHSLGSVPGCIIVKCTNSTFGWAVYHRGTGNTQYLVLNSDTAATSFNNFWNNTDPTSTEFTVNNHNPVNGSTYTYVAYLFAHDAGGFGASGSDNVISCGSFTTPASGDATITLGYEPQWVLIKTSASAQDWFVFDNMRGFAQTSQAYLSPNNALAETNTLSPLTKLTSTGFTASAAGLGANVAFIYIAIRRGPMKTPTTGTSVFSPLTYTGSTSTVRTTNFPVDMQVSTLRGGSAKVVLDRLRGVSTNSTASGPFMITNGTQAESASSAYGLNWNNTGFSDASFVNAVSAATWNFRRAPGFFDVVCYTGDGTGTQNVQHSLGVVPEIIIQKKRVTGDGLAQQWYVVGSALQQQKYLQLNTTDAYLSAPGYPQPTATTFRSFIYNDSCVAYLFATVAGVSKVGSYTGNGGTVNTDGTAQTINCGFSAGARFVLIKRTDSTGDWYVFDSARGIVSASDPYLLLNSTAAEVTTVDGVDPDNSGFIVNQTSGTNLNVTGASYLFLAIS